MIDRREQALAHVVLGVFALIALAPVVKIVLGAGSFATAWDGGTSAPTCARVRS